MEYIFILFFVCIILLFLFFFNFFNTKEDPDDQYKDNTSVNINMNLGANGSLCFGGSSCISLDDVDILLGKKDFMLTNQNQGVGAKGGDGGQSQTDNTKTEGYIRMHNKPDSCTGGYKNSSQKWRISRQPEHCQ